MKLLAAALVMGVVACEVGACGARVARTPDQVVCDGQVNDDPVVKAMIMKGAAVPQFLQDNQDQLKQARAASVRACLERRGVVRPGGVERQRPL